MKYIIQNEQKQQHQDEVKDPSLLTTGQAKASAGSPSSPVAIIGMAFRFPGDLEKEDGFWDALRKNRDLVTRIPDDRWAVAELHHPKRSEAGRGITFSAGVLSRIDAFDAGFFGISPREAAWLDPQQRLLLELSWEAMENAGVPPSSLAGTDCAVYVGIASLDYGTRVLDDLAAMSAHSMTGNTLSIAANRLSYMFDLRGPSLAVDTACSSSLVALHHACRSLQAGETKTALVGGVSLLLHPYPFVGFTKASMLSADGRCKVFDAAGDGYVRAEGGAVLLLKPLDQAIADGDPIQAVILASGVNADGGRKTGLTIPSAEAQAELMRGVLAQSGLNARDVDFIEAHGTGTAVGDPIEAKAIGAVYGQGRETPLPIGSIKANLGHMEAASGMAGLIKAVLALKHRALPAQIHLDTPNPHIDFAGLNLRPVTEYLALEKDSPLVAGVNSFGFGGANAHVLLREFRHDERKAHAPEDLPPLFLSARSDEALRALAFQYAERLKDAAPADYYDVAYGAAYRRDRLEKRLALYAGTAGEAAEKLAAYAQGGMPSGLALEDRLEQAGEVAFVYSGNGAQWVGMGLRLMAEAPEFAATLAELDARMEPMAGFSLLAQLRAAGQDSRLDDTVVAQPLLFAIQVALTRWLRGQGIAPCALAGHSVGEVAAAWAAGAFDLDTAIRVIVARSRAQGATRGSGRMAAVGLSLTDLQAVIAELGEGLDLAIAGINSPKNLTLSGSLADLERLQAQLAPRGVFFRLLDLDYAFHSRHMDSIEGPLREALAGLQPGATQNVTFVSTVTGGPLAGELLDAGYWWRNVREPVRFADAITALAGLGCRIFIEIGPHAILQRYIGECLNGEGVKGRVLPSLHRENDGIERLRETALRVHLLAKRPSFDVYFPQPGRWVRLPNYPWQRERHWHPRTSESLLAIERRRVHPLLGWRIPEAEWAWENVLDPVVLPWLADHRVGGAIVFPGAAYAEMALAAALEWLGGERLAFEELDILAPMVFDGEHARTLRFELNPRDGGFTIKSRQRLSHDAWTLHAAGRLLQYAAVATASLPTAVAEDAIPIERDTHYRFAANLGLDYGPVFQGLRTAHLAGDVLHAEIEPPSGCEAEGYALHPAVLDLCYQSLIDFFHKQIESGEGVALLPVKTGRLVLHRSGPASRFTARLARRSARSVLAEFELFAADGSLMASVSGCRFRAAPLAQRETARVAHWRILPWLKPHPLDARATELPALRELTEAMHQALADQAQGRGAWFKEALPLFEALVLAFAYEAFSEVAAQGQEAFDHLIASTDPYTRWLADLLRGEELLIAREGRPTLAERGDLPPAQALWRDLLRDHPACLPQLVLLGRVGRHLPRLLLDDAARRRGFLQNLLEAAPAETLYEDDPAYAGVRRAIEHILSQVATALPPHRRLRVLEIAAGPSEVPRALLSALPEDRLDYVLALPGAAVERQQAEYAAYPNLTLTAWDESSGLPEWPSGSEQGGSHSFDVIVLRHVLHRTASPQATLHQARRWLAAGGCLLVAERHPDWSADFLHGLDPAWWHATIETTAPLSSLLPPRHWLEALKTAGFDEARDFSEAAAEGIAEGAYLLLARRSREDIVTAPAPQSASWLLLVDESSVELARHLAIHLESQGRQVEIAQAPPARLADGPLPDVRHVVYLRGWQAAPEKAPGLLAETLALTQALAAQAVPPRLWLLTRGAAPAEGEVESSPPNPAQSALWGFGRVVMNELPALRCTLIDLDCDPLAATTPQRLENELLYPDSGNEIILTAQGRYGLVLREEEDRPATPAEAGERFRLDFRVPGQLRNLIWLPQAERALDAGEVEVEVKATGLNFRDVMYLMGLLPDEAVEKGFAGASLGLEFSGIVTRVGPRVGNPRPGDRVMGFGSACFASHVITRADALASMPEDWSFEAAATVPTVFFTVYYALEHLARLQPGERVLIHGAAGGVGIAAIQLATHLGAEVFATAGSEDKRDFVRLLGADHVFDSRSLSFADEILAATAGEGVDVVLNSLAGEAMRRSLAALKPFGRFLELGKRDFFENTPIGLRPFKDNISYFGIDADQLLTSRPQLAARLFAEVMALFRAGALAPLPCRVFTAGHVVEAFRTMQQARHIGKVVVSLAGARPSLERPAGRQPTPRLAHESTWIVSGGLSGFGLESARWLAARGVGHLVLVGRRGLDTPGARAAIAALEAQGVRVRATACDITDPLAVTRLIAEVRRAMPPIKGVLHAAATFDDALLTNLDAARMEAVIAPKLLGAWNLHQATLDVPLEYFVLYSSITTALGNPGQANYVAANMGLEGLAAMRRHLGLPAACVGWGPIGDAGYLARNEGVRDSLAQRLGRAPLTAQEALAQLDRLLTAGGTGFVANFDWSTLARLLPSGTGPRFALLYRELGLASLAVEVGDIRAHIVGKTAEEVADLVRQLVVQEVAQVLAITPERIDPARSLHELGLDSLMAVELALGLEQRLGIQLPVMMINESPTAEKVTRGIVERLLGGAEEDESGSDADALVRGLARQHGESVATEEMRRIAEGARSLAQQGVRLTR